MRSTEEKQTQRGEAPGPLALSLETEIESNQGMPHRKATEVVL